MMLPERDLAAQELRVSSNCEIIPGPSIVLLLLCYTKSGISMRAHDFTHLFPTADTHAGHHETALARNQIRRPKTRRIRTSTFRSFTSLKAKPCGHLSQCSHKSKAWWRTQHTRSLAHHTWPLAFTTQQASPRPTHADLTYNHARLWQMSISPWSKNMHKAPCSRVGMRRPHEWQHPQHILVACQRSHVPHIRLHVRQQACPLT